jgi:hypothetical protein
MKGRHGRSRIISRGISSGIEVKEEKTHVLLFYLVVELQKLEEFKVYLHGFLKQCGHHLS